MLSMLLAYDAAGNVIATLDHLIVTDSAGNLGLVNFDAIENAGAEMTAAAWTVDGATGSKTWPEWLGAAAHEFRVELAGPPGHKRIVALVHRQSGYRRERSVIEGEIASRIAAAAGKPADIRDIVGGPDRPLRLDPEGRVYGREVPNVSLATEHVIPFTSRSNGND